MYLQKKTQHIILSVTLSYSFMNTVLVLTLPGNWYRLNQIISVNPLNSMASIIS